MHAAACLCSRGAGAASAEVPVGRGVLRCHRLCAVPGCLVLCRPQAEVHRVPPPGTTCALCHAMEAPGAHMDQAKALRSSGLSNRGLGPLMPVCMPPSKQAASGNTASQAPAGSTGTGAAATEADSRPAEGAAATPEPAAAAAAAAGSEPAAEGEVVWLHRQCALWSPEVYPDKSGVLVSTFPGSCWCPHSGRWVFPSPASTLSALAVCQFLVAVRLWQSVNILLLARLAAVCRCTCLAPSGVAGPPAAATAARRVPPSSALSAAVPSTSTWHVRVWLAAR